MECPTNEIIKAGLNFGGALAVKIGKYIQRFLGLPLNANALLPIWVLHTYVFDRFEFTPYLNIVSPEPGCGKTTAGDVLSALCCRATSPTVGTAAVLRRMVAENHPTLVIDEWDSLDHPVRRACYNFLNTGFRKDGTYSVVAGGEILTLSTFCPKAIIGRSTVPLPEATLSRCISFTMDKALPNEKHEKFRTPHREEAEWLRGQCERWAEEFRASKDQGAPSPLETLNARQQDICEPLLLIAEHCGGPWPLILRQALSQLLVRQHVVTPENELLQAVAEFIRGLPEKKYFSSKEFCLWAKTQEARPWSEKPLTPAKMAEMLSPYHVFPNQINRMVEGYQKNVRGYFVEQFREAFARYLGISGGE